MRRRFWIAVLVFAIAALPPVTGQATDLPPTSTVQQQWDLLAQEVSAADTTVVPIRRGTVGPGAGMLPVPTVTLAAVGRVAGATSAAKWWVQVRKLGGGVLGTVGPFMSSDSSMVTKTANFAWPASSSDLFELRLYWTLTELGTQGTFHLNKVYLRLSQTGTIMATKGSVPLAGTEWVVPGSSWTDLGDPILYRHTPAGIRSCT